MNRPKLSRLDLFLDWLISSRPKIRELERLTQEQQIRLGHLETRAELFDAVRVTVGDLAHFGIHEEKRTNYALALAEGTLKDLDSYHQLRDTPEYLAAFTTPNPLVTVCVTTSHRPDLLIERCLTSLQQQTYKNLQIIVVGDNCIDSTPERVAALKDERITFINLPERGPYPPPGWDRWCVAGTHAVNKALTLCEGQFVTHLDDDDRFEPDRIEIMLRTAQETGSDFLWHSMHFQLADGSWHVLGDGKFRYSKIGTGMIFYHRYFARYPWDVYAYRVGEPGDWNRLRKILMLRPKLHYLDRPLLHHYYGSHKEPFVAREGERFLT